jgi:hypothetical protein
MNRRLHRSRCGIADCRPQSRDCSERTVLDDAPGSE